MFINDFNHNNTSPKNIIDWLKSNTLIKIIAFATYTLLIFLIGVFYHITTIPDEDIKSDLNNPLIKFVSDKFDPKISVPEVIEFGISQKDIQKLTEKRESAIASGVLMSSSRDYVPAKIRHKNKKVRAKVRLKGDWVDHLTSSKWSLRVSIKGDDTLFGMKEFSIQHPVHRNYLGEWFLQKVMKKENILGLDFDFIEVIINGHNFGIYAIEEHFDKRLIENNHFREGIIVKFDEDLRWANIQKNFKDAELPSTYYSSAIEIFQSKKIKSNKTKREHFKKAFNLLERFRNKELQPEKVFDYKKMASFYALNDFLGGQHATVFHNLRFYYNPITSKLEPIAFDAMGATEINKLLAVQAIEEDDVSFDFDRRLFSDEFFMKKYLSELERFSRKSYLDNLIINLADELNKKVNILNREFSNYDSLTELKNTLVKNSNFIRNFLNPVKGVHAYFENFDGKNIILRIGNIQGLPIELKAISRNGFVLFRPEKKIILKGKKTSQPVTYQNVKFDPVGKFNFTEKNISELNVEYNILNTGYKNLLTIFPYPNYDENFLNNDFIRQPPNANEFSFLVTNEKERVIFIKPGNWKLTRNLIIPSGYIVVASTGVKIDLVSGAKILSFSPLKFVGDEENPIVIYSSDGSGQGIAVLNTQKNSIFDFVYFNNLSAPKEAGWELTGAVTFYQSPIKILNCQFNLNHSSDDFLNIVRSDFEIRNSHFSQIFADAIDVDFSDGAIFDLSFKRIGNDALDFSGSYANLFNITIDEAMDKGISVGEGSKILAMNVDINRSKIALACKDSSELLINKGNINNSRIGFTVFQKKPEFGPARIESKFMSLHNVKTPYMVQDGSKLIYNDTIINGTP